MMFSQPGAAAGSGGMSVDDPYANYMEGRSSDNGPSLDEYKDAATKVVSKVGEKASELKNSAVDWFSQFTAPQ